MWIGGTKIDPCPFCFTHSVTTCVLIVGDWKGKVLHYNNKGKQNMETNTDDAVVRVCCDLLPVRVKRVRFFCKRITCISKVLVSELEGQKRTDKNWKEVRRCNKADV